MKKRGGFTLIELSLSLVFIAILSLTVVLLIQNSMASFRRGLVLNQVNTVGMDLIDDIRASVQYATSDPATRMCEMYYGKDERSGSNYMNCMDDGAFSFISMTTKAKVKVVSTTTGDILIDETLPVYGAFCTGTYTYMWVSGYYESADGETRDVAVSRPKLGITGSVDSTGSVSIHGIGVYATDFLEEPAGGTTVDTTKFENFRFLKVYDNERSICVNAMKNKLVNSNDYAKDNDSLGADNMFLLSKSANEEGPIDLLDQKDANDLVLYDFYVSRPAISQTKQNMFYAASFILGTRRGGININQVGNNCKPPSDVDSMLDYCAINNFNFAVQAGGE